MKLQYIAIALIALAVAIPLGLAVPWIAAKHNMAWIGLISDMQGRRS